MRNWSCKFNMSHAFASNFEVSYFNTTTITNYTFVTNRLEFTTVTFPFFCSTENSFTEQTVFLWTESSVIYCFWLFNFTIRPCTNSLWRSKLNHKTIKILNITHYLPPKLEIRARFVNKLFITLCKRNLFSLGIINCEIQSQTTKFLNQYVKCFWNTSSC